MVKSNLNQINKNKSNKLDNLHPTNNPNNPRHRILNPTKRLHPKTSTPQTILPPRQHPRFLQIPGSWRPPAGNPPPTLPNILLLRSNAKNIKYLSYQIQDRHWGSIHLPGLAFEPIDRQVDCGWVIADYYSGWWHYWICCAVYCKVSDELLWGEMLWCL